MSYGVIRTDRMFGTDNRAGLISVKYMGADGETPTAIENGCVVKVGGLMEGEREVYLGTAPEGGETKEQIAIIATPEMMYDEHKHDLDEFINKAGKICRAYRPHSGDIFSVTIDALDATDVAVGNAVSVGEGVKLAVSASADAPLGTVIAIDQVGKYTYYVIQVL